MAAKYSSFAQARKLLESPAALALAAPFAGLAAHGVQSAAGKLMESRRKATAYKEMLELHPSLTKGKDRKHVQRIYNSLHHVNPGVAGDPLVAGAWVHNIIETSRQYGEDEPSQALLGAVRDLAGVRQSMASARASEARMGGALREAVTSSVGGFGAAKSEQKLDQTQKALAQERALHKQTKAEHGIARQRQGLKEQEQSLKRQQHALVKAVREHGRIGGRPFRGHRS